MSMRAVLIAEDEKNIRHGIAAMVRRGPVAVERIIECRNGEEALHALRDHTVDLVITDVRMPKMDGFELVRQIGGLPHPPPVVVISGYDDFDYVSNMLRMGVRDYILKPVGRDRLQSLLLRMDTELDEARREDALTKSYALQILRAHLQGQDVGDGVLAAAAQRLGPPSLWESYGMACLSAQSSVTPLPNALAIGAIGDGQFWLFPHRELAALCKQDGGTHCMGLSAGHAGPAGLRTAFNEAMAARQCAFVHGRTACGGSLRASASAVDPRQTCEQFIQLVGIGQAPAARSLLGQLLLWAQNDALSPADYLATMVDLQSQMASMVPTAAKDVTAALHLAHPLAYRSAFDYYTDCCTAAELLCDQAARAEASQNEQKIAAAIDYLHKHFTDEIDMAVVSNHVSMNYSQFSSLFKRQTGQNFQQYLRTLRIDESKRLLRETGLSIREVSECSGFKNEKHFMRVFKLYMAVSPSEYRSNTRSK